MYYEEDSRVDCDSSQIGRELIGEPPTAPVLDGLIKQRPAETFSGDPHRIATLGEESDQVARPPFYLDFGSNNHGCSGANQPLDSL
jgi:hypothetical protein